MVGLELIDQIGVVVDVGSRRFDRREPPPGRGGSRSRCLGDGFFLAKRKSRNMAALPCLFFATFPP